MSASAPHTIEARLLRRLWERMAAIYPHRWVSAMGASPHDGTGALTIAAETWGRALADLTPEQLARGLEACAAGADGWPPSLPEYRAMCLGIPSLAKVRQEIHSGAPSSGYTRLVWQHLDTWAMRYADRDDADRMIRDAYSLAYDHVMRGGELPPAPVAALTDAPADRPPANPTVAKEALRRMREILGVPAEASP